MRYLGSMRDKSEAYKDAERVAKEQGHTVVIEKAKAKVYPSPKRFVCYRAWLDLDLAIPQVISYEEWKARRNAA